MAISRQKKEKIVQDLHGKSENASILVFVNFHGLSVAKITKLRRALRQVGADFKVAKKRLIKRVLDGFGLAGDVPNLEGEVGILSVAGEPIEPVQVLSKFAKDKEFAGMQILGGVFEKSYINMSAVKQLALIPSREVLLAQLVGAIASPLRGFVGVLSGPMRDLVGVISNLTKR